MSLPAQIRDVLPGSTATTWPVIARVAPAGSALMGGTALAVHLSHRVSRDLDVFTTDEFDPDALERRLGELGAFAATSKAEGTLNGVFDDTKVQFLWARGQRTLIPPSVIAGMPIGSLADVFATKVKVIGDRGELRDYFDLMKIERDTGRRFEEGLSLYLARYQLDVDHQSVMGIVRSIGYFDDVERDPLLEETISEHVFDVVRRYWERRQPEIIAHLDQYGIALPDTEVADEQALDRLRGNRPE